MELLETNSGYGREDAGSSASHESGDGIGSKTGMSTAPPLYQRRGLQTYSFEEEDEEFEEALGLLGHPIADHTDFEEETQQGRTNSANAWKWWILTMVVVAVFSRLLHHKESRWKESHADERLPPQYDCPIEKKDASSSQNTDAPLPSDNPVPNAGSDEASKKNLRDWTAQQIAPYLLDVDADKILNRVFILETSSPTGGFPGLFLTLQLLEEMQADSKDNPTQFWVYGSEQDSFRSSFSFVHQEEKLQKLPNVHLGIICSEEDAPLPHLSYIPVDSFDMVYTGHIPPLIDPLEFEQPSDNLTAQYQAVCMSGEKDRQGQILKNIAQQNQEKWFATWVGNMARVLRPGGLVLIENLTGPFCEHVKDGGGVTKEWWSTIVKELEQEWDIEPASLTIGDDHLRKSHYHVAMRRKERQVETTDGGG